MTLNMDHDELIEEMRYMERMSAMERIALARRRRLLQLNKYREWSLSSLGNGADPESFAEKQGNKKKLKFSPEVNLFESVTKGDVEELKELLAQGVNPNIRNYEGLTPLHQCCIEGYCEMAEMLLEKGANVNASDMDGWTPLHAAATCGHKSIVELLVRMGADLLASNSDEDMPFEITEDEETLYILEAEMTYQGITDQMVTERRRVAHSILQRDIVSLLRLGGDLDIPVTPDGASLLHVTAANFYNDLVKLLIKNGASDKVIDDEGWRPIHVAAYWGNSEGLKLLVKQCNTDIEAKTFAGETPYSLCDDPNLKMYIKELQNKENIAESINRNSHYMQDQDFLNLHYFLETRAEISRNDGGIPAELIHLNVDDDIQRRVSSDELPAINPLLNPEANERASERKTSLKEAKKSAPNFRSQTERMKDSFSESPDELIVQDGDSEVNKQLMHNSNLETLSQSSTVIISSSVSDIESAPTIPARKSEPKPVDISTKSSNSIKEDVQTSQSTNKLVSPTSPTNLNPSHSSKNLPKSSLISLKNRRLQQRQLAPNSSKRFSQIDEFSIDKGPATLRTRSDSDSTTPKYSFKEAGLISPSMSIVKDKRRCSVM